MKLSFTSSLILLIVLACRTTALYGNNGDCPSPFNITSEIISANSVMLSWSDISESSGYSLRIKEGDNNSHDFDLEINTTNSWYMVDDLVSNQQYEFRIRTLCGDDHSNWAEDFYFMSGGSGDNNNNTSCTTPTGLNVSNITENSVTISWEAVDGVDGFEVEVEDGISTPPFEFNANTSATSVDVSGLVPNGEYKVKVKSKCSGGNNSEYSEWVFFEATPGSIPNTGNIGICLVPTGLSVSNITNNSATISWDDMAGVNIYEVEVEDGDNTPAFSFDLLTTATTIEVSGLTANGEYKVKVKSKCSGGNNSEYSNLVFFNATPGSVPTNSTDDSSSTSCSIPSGLAVSDISETSATISWNAVDGVDNYEVDVEDGDNTPLFDFNQLTTATSIDVNGLTANGEYKVKVKSKCSGGNNSEYSNLVFFNATPGSVPTNSTDNSSSTSCSIPSGLSVSNITETSATITWNAVDGVDNYEVEVEDGDNTPLFDFNEITTATTIEVSGLTTNGEYKVKVKSKCSGGNNSEYSNLVFFNAIPGSVPTNSTDNSSSTSCSISTGLSVSDITETSATITWNAVDGVDNYEVDVEDGDNTPLFDFNEITTATTIEVSGLTANGEYKVKVKSKCSGGNNSEYSNLVFFNATPESVPTNSTDNSSSTSCSIPTGLAVSDISETSATISWNAVDGVDNYEVEVEDGDNTPLFDFIEITTATTIEVSGLTANGEYKVKVKSKCSGGNNSEYSDWVFFNASPGSVPTNSTDDNGSSSCSIPSGLTVSNILETSATITWNAVDGVDNYEVEVEDGDNTLLFDFNEITIATSIGVSGLTANGEYKVKVKSKCSGGNNSEYSDWVFFNANPGSVPTNSTGNSSNTSCSIPTGLTVSEITEKSATISWNAVDGVDNYEVEVEDGDNTPFFNLNSITSATTFEVSGLVANGEYKVKVKSKCSGGNNSEYSEWVLFNATMVSSPVDCTSPLTITLSEVAATTATLVWSSIAGAQGYHLEFEELEDTPDYSFQIVILDTKITVVGLVPGGTYRFRLKTNCNDGSENEFSDWKIFKTLAESEFNSEKINIKISSINTTQAEMNWNQIPGAHSFSIIIEEVEENGFGFMLIDEVEDNKFLALDLSPNSSYSVTVRAVFADGKLSEWSDEIFFKTSVELSSSIEFDVYPNPVVDFIRVRFKNNTKEESVEIQIIDNMGRLHKSYNKSVFSGFTQEIPVSDLPGGIYTVLVRSDESRLSSKRLMIAH